MRNLITQLNILLVLATFACGPANDEDKTAPEGGGVSVTAVASDSVVINITEASDKITPLEKLVTLCITRGRDA